MTNLEHLWGYFLLAGAVAMAGFTVLTAVRGWVRNEDGEIHHREHGPRAFLFTQFLQFAGVLILIYVGIKALNGWK